MRLILPLTALLFAVLSVLRFGSHANADTFVSSIASIQHPTLFYWGENRFLSVVAIALSWEKDPFANLFLSSVICAFSFYLLLLLVARFGNKLIDKGDGMDQALCFLILCGIFLAGLMSDLFYRVAIDPSQPYSLSYLLLVTAAWLVFFCSWYPVLSVLGAGVAAFVATGVNFSVILAAGAMSIAAGRFLSLGKACLFFGLCAASFAFWYWVSQYYAGPSYYTLGDRGALVNLSASLHQIAASVRPVPVASLLAILLALRITIRGGRSCHLVIFLGAMLAFGLVWWIVISQNSWAQANGLNARYFFPTLFCFAAALAVALWARAVVAAPRTKLALIIVLTIAIFGVLVRPIQPFTTYPALSEVRNAAAFAREHKIRYVSGNYWLAWPVVFLLLDRPNAAFGMTFRGEAVLSKVRNAVRADALSGSSVNALCLADPVASCQQLLSTLTGRAWQISPLDCPGSCKVLTLTRPDAHEHANPDEITMPALAVDQGRRNWAAANGAFPAGARP